MTCELGAAMRRYVAAGTAWLNGAFSKVAKAGHVAGTKTREKLQVAVSNLTAKARPCAPPKSPASLTRTHPVNA